MFSRSALPILLVSLVSVPAYLLGLKLRHGEGPLLLLTALTLAVVCVAGAILRQYDGPR